MTDLSEISLDPDSGALYGPDGVVLLSGEPSRARMGFSRVDWDESLLAAVLSLPALLEERDALRDAMATLEAAVEAAQ